MHARLKVTPLIFVLGLLQLMQEEVAADGGRDDDSHGFQCSCLCEKSIVVHLDFLLEVEGIVDGCIELLVDFSGGGSIGSLTDGVKYRDGTK